MVDTGAVGFGQMAEHGAERRRGGGPDDRTVRMLSQPRLARGAVETRRRQPAQHRRRQRGAHRRGEGCRRAVDQHRYHYEFTRPGDGSRDWWRRTYVGEYLRPLALDDPELRRFLEHAGWQ
jgi:hypothetical protein